MLHAGSCHLGWWSECEGPEGRGKEREGEVEKGRRWRERGRGRRGGKEVERGERERVQRRREEGGGGEGRREG